MAEPEVDVDTQPLLDEQHAPWEAVSAEQGVQPALSIEEVFKQRPDNVLTTISTKGVSKLGEFRAAENLVFPAFEGDVICTFGSRTQMIDYERVWRQELHKLVKTKPSGWSQDVIVEAFVVNIKGAARPDKDGLLQPLLRRWNAGGVSLAVWGLPAVQAVVDFKWDTFARRLMLWELAVFVVWCLAFATFTVLFQDEDLSLSLGQLVSTERGLATVIAEGVALAAMVPFLILEQGTLSAYGLRGWMNIWNAQDIVTYVLQISITVLHLGRWVQSGWISVTCAVQVVLLLFRLQWFSRCFTSTRWSFLETVREAMASISVFLVFVLMVMLGFGVSFHVLFRLDQDTTEGFDTIFDAFLTMFENQGSMIDLTMTRKSHNPITATSLSIAYYVIMGMILLNMLIGIMSTAVARSSEHEALKLLLSKAQVIDELESTLPSWIEKRFRGTWYPDFVHILRIDPDRIDRVDLDSLWAKGGDAQLGTAAELQQKVDAMQKQLQRVEGLLVQLQGALLTSQQQNGQSRAAGATATSASSVQ